MKYIGMAVVVHDGKILIAQRKKSMNQGGLWEFPGGKIETGETPIACIKREFMEELGMKVEVGDYLMEMTYTYPVIGELHFDTYWASCNQLVPIQLEAHEQIAWVSLNELEQYDFCPADRPLVQKLKSSKLPS